jgi:hypothetical protein
VWKFLKSLFRPSKPKLWFKAEPVFAYKPLGNDVVPIIFKRENGRTVAVAGDRAPCPAAECYKGLVPDYKTTGLTPEGRQPTKVCMVCMGNGFIGGE